MLTEAGHVSLNFRIPSTRWIHYLIQISYLILISFLKNICSIKKKHYWTMIIFLFTVFVNRLFTEYSEKISLWIDFSA